MQVFYQKVLSLHKIKLFNSRMKTIFRTYQFELQPTQEQKVLLDKHFGCIRYVYNYFLNERKEQYQADKKSDNYYKQAATLTELKKKEETDWLKEVNSQSLQFALRCLDTAYVNFFRGNAKFPRFKSRKKKNSFTVPQFAKLEDGRFFAPKFKEGIKVNVHREVKGKIGKCTLSKTPTGKYFVSILSEEKYHQKEKTGAVDGDTIFFGADTRATVNKVLGRLRSEFGISALDTGRICVAALNQSNIDAVTKAIVQVL